MNFNAKTEPFIYESSKQLLEILELNEKQNTLSKQKMTKIVSNREFPMSRSSLNELMHDVRSPSSNGIRA